METFALERIAENFPLLNRWLDAHAEFSTQETDLLEKLRSRAARKVDFWNEETLKMLLIAPLLSFFINFEDEKRRFESFFNQTIFANVEGIFCKPKLIL